MEYSMTAPKIVRKGDTRRICDGIRLHPFLGEILSYGARQMRSQNPGTKITNLDFCRSAIAQLASLDLIYRIEARTFLLPGLKDRLAKLARRQQGTPIWFPTDELADRWIDIWSELTPSLQGKVIAWRSCQL
jgi:hypothetical protein